MLPQKNISFNSSFQSRIIFVLIFFRLLLNENQVTFVLVSLFNLTQIQKENHIKQIFWNISHRT